MLELRPFERQDVFDVELDYELTKEARFGLSNYENIAGYTMVEGDKLIAVGGAHIMWFGVGELWLLLSPEGKRRGGSFARLTKGIVDDICKDHNLRRMQASIHADDQNAIRFAEWLGLEHEGLMRSYGVRGEDYLRMARIA